MRRLFSYIWVTVLLSASLTSIAQDTEIIQPPEVVQMGNGILSSIDWRPDGEQLAVGSNQSIWLLSPELDQREQIEITNSKVVRWSPDNNSVAIGRWDGFVEIRDVNTWETILSFQVSSSPVRDIRWSPTGHQVATLGTGETSIVIWASLSGEQLYSLSDDAHGEATSFDWSPDGDRLVVGYRQGLVRIWDIASQQTRVEFTQHPIFVASVVWQPDGNLIASSGVEGGSSGTSANTAILIWNADTGEIIHSFRTEQWWNTSPIAWSPDGDFLAGTSQAGSNISAFEFSTAILVWDVSTGNLINEWNILEDNQIVELFWQPNGDFLSYRKSLRRQNQLVNICGDELIGTINVFNGDGHTFRLEGHTTEIDAIEWSPNNQWLASGSADKTIRLWDTSTGEEIVVLEGHQCRVQALNWSPDNDLLASYGTDDTVRVWNVADGENLLSDEFTIGFVGSLSQTLAWSPQADYLAAASNQGTVRVWDLSSRTTTYDIQIPLSDPSIGFAVLSWTLDDPKLAIAQLPSTEVEIWNVSESNPTLIRTLTGFTGDVYTAAWSPDGSRLAVYSSDSKITIWNTETGEIVHILENTSSYIPQIMWNLTGDKLLVNQNVYDVDDGVFLATIGVQGIHLRWSPNGRSLAGVTSGNVIKIWDISGLLE